MDTRRDIDDREVANFLVNTFPNQEGFPCIPYILSKNPQHAVLVPSQETLDAILEAFPNRGRKVVRKREARGMTKMNPECYPASYICGEMGLAPEVPFNFHLWRVPLRTFTPTVKGVLSLTGWNPLELHTEGLQQLYGWASAFNSMMYYREEGRNNDHFVCITSTEKGDTVRNEHQKKYGTNSSYIITASSLFYSDREAFEEVRAWLRER